jgi:hypothetical protein
MPSPNHKKVRIRRRRRKYKPLTILGWVLVVFVFSFLTVAVWRHGW